jgi:hypothetical protein
MEFRLEPGFAWLKPELHASFSVFQGVISDLMNDSSVI